MPCVVLHVQQSRRTCCMQPRPHPFRLCPACSKMCSRWRRSRCCSTAWWPCRGRTRGCWLPWALAWAVPQPPLAATRCCPCHHMPPQLQLPVTQHWRQYQRQRQQQRQQEEERRGLCPPLRQLACRPPGPTALQPGASCLGQQPPAPASRRQGCRRLSSVLPAGHRLPSSTSSRRRTSLHSQATVQTRTAAWLRLQRPPRQRLPMSAGRSMPKLLRQKLPALPALQAPPLVPAWLPAAAPPPPTSPS